MNRDPYTLSFFNPPDEGDTVQLQGANGPETWTIAKGANGWLLHKPGDRFTVHPLIKDIFALTDFIELLELAAPF